MKTYARSRRYPDQHQAGLSASVADGRFLPGAMLPGRAAALRAAQERSQPQQGIRGSRQIKLIGFQRSEHVQKGGEVGFPSSVDWGRIPALRSGNYDGNPFWIERSPLVGCPPVHSGEPVAIARLSRSLFTAVNQLVHGREPVDFTQSFLFTVVNSLILRYSQNHSCFLRSRWSLTQLLA